jgi:alkanesulfonate monooxygenase
MQSATPTHPAKPTPIRFHWSLSAVGDPMRAARARSDVSGLPDFAAHVEFCQRAAEYGIDALLVAIGAHRPDPFTWSAALGRATERVRFLCAIRSGLSSPTYFVQQVNTVAALTGGRICINVVAGHSPHEHRYYGDFLDHDERYARTDEFWQICHGLWRGDGPVDFDGTYYRVEGARVNTPFAADGRSRPEIYLGGSSRQAEELAVKHADCLLQLAKAPEVMAPTVRSVTARGTEVGIQVSIISRPTHEEAVRAARDLVAGLGERPRQVQREFRGRSDSVVFTSTHALADGGREWVTPYLWAGAVPYLGPASLALVGSPEEIAEAIWSYRQIGVTQFLLIGWPDLPTMTFFAEHIAPLVRAREAAAAGSPM